MERKRQSKKLEVRISEDLLAQFDAKIKEIGTTRSKAVKIMIKDFCAPELRPIEGPQR